MQEEQSKVTSHISPIRRESAPLSQYDDRYVVIDRGDYNRLTANSNGAGTVAVFGMVALLVGGAALVIAGLKPQTVVTQEKPVIIEKPVIVQCGLFGCKKE